MGNENERTTEPLLGFDVGLGFKMQLQQQPTATASYYNTCCHGSNATSDYASSAFPIMSSYSSSSAHAFGSGSSSSSGKSIFTASQWQELERQKMIHKYMMAAVPVPPQLLLSVNYTTPSYFIPHLSSHTNRSGLDLRFSSTSSLSGSSDPEPWRCKRTDGKKWRCSRDVAPDQKYCERHAHKSRTRSRKHVEAVQTTSLLLSSQNKSSSSTSSKTTSPYSTQHHHQQPLIFPSNNNISCTGYSTMTSSCPATSYDQIRCMEWFLKGGASNNNNSRKTNPVVSTYNSQQWQQQPIHTSSSSSTDKNVSSVIYHHQYQPQYDDHHNKQEQVGFMSLNSYNNIKNYQQHHQNTSLGSSHTPTRHFIDAWENEGKTKFDQQQQQPSSSLSLSMQSGGAGNVMTDHEDSDLNIGMVNSDSRESDHGILRTQQHQWLNNPISWMNMNCYLPPGGPLGEALCLGDNNNNSANTTTRGCLDLVSPRNGGGYSNSVSNNDNNTNSSCSEDGSHGLNFIG